MNGCCRTLGNLSSPVVFSAKPCPASPAVTNAVPSSPSGVYRDIVTYACATGYSQSGGSTGQRTCTVAGTWFQDQPDPVCTSKPMDTGHVIMRQICDGENDRKHFIACGGGGGFFLACEDSWRMFDFQIPACVFFFFLSGDYLAHTNSTL